MKTIDLTYQHNLRDLGGYTGFNGKKVKYGKLFRSGLFNKLTDEDIEIIKSLGITDIIDFRSQVEYTSHPDIRVEGIEYHNLPPMYDDPQLHKLKSADSNLLWFLKETDKGFEHMCAIYKDLVSSPTSIKAYREFFKIIMREGVVVDFHCSQGKDRAGFAAYLILSALGVSEEDIMNDYLYSNLAMKEKIAKFRCELKDKPYWNEKYEQSLIDVFSARVEYIENAKEEIVKKYSSLMNYMTTVLDVDIDRLRELFLE